MKKLYTLTLLLFVGVASFAQTFYSENFGTPSGNPTATAFTGYQNTTPIVYTGTADLRTTAASSGYSGASGSGNVFFNADTEFLQISGLNSSPYASADIQLTFGTNSATALALEVSTNGTDWTAVPYTPAAGSAWQLITVSGGVIPSSATLSLRWTANSTTQIRIDDVKLSSVSASCALALGTESTLCDAFTVNLDTYTATIPFTGGGTATYGITATSGTIGGDNPTTTASGNITITGVVEGTNVTVTVTGGTCNLSKEVIAPGCKAVSPLPYSESFDYTVGNALGSEQRWSNYNSGDNINIASGNLTYSGVNASGNSAAFAGDGLDVSTQFSPVTSGTVYTSFLTSVVDFGAITAENTSTYFAVLTDPTNGFKIRVYLKKVGTQYQLGATSATSATDADYAATLFNAGDVVAIVLGYDFTANEVKFWLNPNFTTFTASTPATLSYAPTTPIDNIGAFLLRQDSNGNTPTMVVDELRVATTTAGLLSAPSFNAIAGLKMYPNPVNNGMLYLASDANAQKAVVIYDIVGKEVINTVTNDAVNVANLTSGVYIVKVTEEGNTATRKLVIR